MIPSRLHKSKIKILNPTCPLIKNHPLNKNLVMWNTSVPEWGRSIFPDLANPQNMMKNHTGLTTIGNHDGDTYGRSHDGTPALIPRRPGVIYTSVDNPLYGKVKKFGEPGVDGYYVPNCPGHLGYLSINPDVALMTSQNPVLFSKDVYLNFTLCFWLSKIPGRGYGSQGGSRIYGERDTSGYYIWKVTAFESSISVTLRTGGGVWYSSEIYGTSPGWADSKWNHYAG